MTFGEYLRELRVARRLAKNKFATMLGVPFSTVNKWELHGAAPQQANMNALIKALELTSAEKSKLTELWLAMPRSREGTPPVAPEAAPPSPRTPKLPTPSTAAEKALEALLTRAVVPERHSMFDAVAVFHAVAEAAGLIEGFGLSESAARAWLDAAAILREKGIKVTAAGLLASTSAPAIPSVPKKSDTTRDVTH